MIVHRHIVAAAAAVVVTLGTSALAGEPDVAAHVAELAAELDEPQWAVRHQAEKRLMQLDPAALPAIEAILAELPADEAESRSRLNRVAASLRARSEKGGREVRLSLNAAEPAKTVHALADEAGVDLYVAPNLPGRATTGTYDGAFWDVLLELCRQNGWDVSWSSGGEQNLSATIVAAGQSQNGLAGPAFISGPVLFTVRGGHFDRSVSFDQVAATGGDFVQRSRSFGYELAAHLEPRFQVGPRTFEIEWTEARDAFGRSLLPGDAQNLVADVGMLQNDVAEADRNLAGRPAGRFVTSAEWRAGRLPFTVSLRADDTDALDRVTLAGRLRGLVGSSLTDMTADVADGTATEWCVAGEPIVVRLEQGRQINSDGDVTRMWHVNFEILRPLSADLEQLVLATLAECKVTLADGGTLRRGATRTRTLRNGAREYQVDFSGETAAMPVAVRCRVPARAMRLDVPFRFEDLPVP